MTAEERDEPFVPDRLKAATEALPADYVIVPRFCVERIYEAGRVDFEARDGYGGVVIDRENALDGWWFYHMFVAALEGDYLEYDEHYGPQGYPPSSEQPDKGGGE